MGTTGGKLSGKKLDRVIRKRPTATEEPLLSSSNSTNVINSDSASHSKFGIQTLEPVKALTTGSHGGHTYEPRSAPKDWSKSLTNSLKHVEVDAKAFPADPTPDEVAQELLIEHPDAPVSANGLPPLETPTKQPPAYSAKAVNSIARSLGKQSDSLKYTAGCLVLCGLVFCLGAAPQALPLLYLVFAATAIPFRIVSFVQRKWVFFLVDYCYFANLAAVAYLVFAPTDLRMGAMVYALCEGPLAAALIPWQCAWLLGSPDHTISVLIHMLPGLALYCHRFFSATKQPLQLLQQATFPLLYGDEANATSVTSATARVRIQGQRALSYPGPAPEPAWLWLFAAPVIFYVTWQFVYWLIVQVIFKRKITAGKYDTSYLTLSRRAKRANNFWYRLVQGNAARRLTLYGLLQLAFTLVTLVIGAASYRWFVVATAWQVVKLTAPLYYGARHQCERLPAQQFEQGMKRLVGAGALAAAMMTHLDGKN